MYEANFWILDASGETFGNISSILEVLGVLLGGLGCCLGFDLRCKIDVKKEICDFVESVLSPAWEHGFCRSEGHIFNYCWWYGMVFEGL